MSFALVACTGIDLSPVNPAGANLSGEWLVDLADSDVVNEVRSRAPAKRRRSNNPSVRREARRLGQGSGLAFVVHDFQVLRAETMRIELNRDSMGVRYTPGVYRDISWGERQRGLWEVNAGWEAQDLVIDSKGGDLKVLERFVRVGDDRLIVQVAIDADGEKMEYRRSFQRQK